MTKRATAPRPTSSTRPPRRRVTPTPAPAPPVAPFYFSEGMIFSALCFFGAVLGFATQAIFRRDLASGEFGVLNATLGLVGLLGVPLNALNQAVTHHLARHHARAEDKEIENLRAAARKLLIAAALGSALAALLLSLLLGWLIHLPRLSLGVAALVLVWVTLGGTLSGAFCLGLSRFRFWGGLVLGASLLRLTLAASLSTWEPWAETGLIISIATGLVMLVPLFQDRSLSVGWAQAWRSFAHQPFLLYLAAALSVALGLFLFPFSDQIIAQKWFGPQPDGRDPITTVSSGEYDSYQAAGVLGRALIWGTQPLLLVFFTQRSRRGTPLWKGFNAPSVRALFSGYRLVLLDLAALIVGVVLLTLLRSPICQLFTGRDDFWTERFIFYFAVAMVPIGLLQVLGTYFLASRRTTECYLFGACSVAYALLLYCAGRQPELLLTYMTGGTSFILFGLFFFLIIKWSRSQP